MYETFEMDFRAELALGLGLGLILCYLLKTLTSRWPEVVQMVKLVDC